MKLKMDFEVLSHLDTLTGIEYKQKQLRKELTGFSTL